MSAAPRNVRQARTSVAGTLHPRATETGRIVPMLLQAIRGTPGKGVGARRWIPQVLSSSLCARGARSAEQRAWVWRSAPRSQKDHRRICGSRRGDAGRLLRGKTPAQGAAGAGRGDGQDGGTVAGDDPSDADGVSEQGALLHLEWWDTVSYREGRRDWIPTTGSVPESLLLAIADARTAVLTRILGATGEERDRLFKLLWFMDRLLFAQPAGVKKKANGAVNLDGLISARLHTGYPTRLISLRVF